MVSGPQFWRAAYGEPAVPGPGPYGSLDGLAADANGVVLAEGFTSRIVATSGEPVPGSDYTWHVFPDGGACFDHPDGGWVYASNSEVPDGGGGVGALVFDSDAKVVDAYRLLSETSRNCAGGPTPWGTWLTGEEVDEGLIWECNPLKADSGQPRPALGVFTHEAAAVDQDGKALYLTEDKPDGRLYRFVPDDYPDLSKGELSVAIVADGKVTWEPVADPLATTRPTRLQGKGTVFNGGEGIWCEDGVAFFTTKGDDRVWALDLGDSTLEVIYDAAAIPDAPLTGVDNVTRSASGDLYVCEDGGNMELVIISREREVGPFCRFLDQGGSELAGVAFSPDGSRLYVSSQRGGSGSGLTYEITGPFREAEKRPTATTTTAHTTTTLAALDRSKGDNAESGDSGSDEDSSTTLVAGGIAAVAVAAAAGAALTVRRRRAGNGADTGDGDEERGAGTAGNGH